VHPAYLILNIHIQYILHQEIALFSILEFRKGQKNLEINKWYFAKYILFKKNTDVDFLNPPDTSLSVGRNIIMKNKTSMIVPNIICNFDASNGSNSYAMRLYNFRVRPLEMPFELGVIQGSDSIAIWRKNNTHNTDDKIEDVAKNILLPHDLRLLTIKL
jgi:hypothetical protein